MNIILSPKRHEITKNTKPKKKQDAALSSRNDNPSGVTTLCRKPRVRFLCPHNV